MILNDNIPSQKGTVWSKMRLRTREALASGDLQPIPTEPLFIDDGGVSFLVRIVTNLKRKAEDRNRTASLIPQTGADFNPFLPYDRSLFVCDLTRTHVALLNKFNVVDDHLLIVTRHFEDQDLLLTDDDFTALQICLNDFEGLGFYNGGRVAGASQKHRHLQFVPLPLADRGPAVPLEPLFGELGQPGEIVSSARLPFRHLLAARNQNASLSIEERATEVSEIYRSMMKSSHLIQKKKEDSDWQAGPYNLLVTRSWVLLVPRKCEFYDSMSLNALAFAGALLVRDDRELSIVRQTGPLKILSSTTFH